MAMDCLNKKSSEDKPGWKKKIKYSNSGQDNKSKQDVSALEDVPKNVPRKEDWQEKQNP